MQELRTLRFRLEDIRFEERPHAKMFAVSLLGNQSSCMSLPLTFRRAELKTRPDEKETGRNERTRMRGSALCLVKTKWFYRRRKKKLK